MGQRATRRGLRPLLTLTAMIAATASAHAEQLLMPFACDARSGEVRLTPSDQRAYQIYGRREHHVFTVCSPVDQSQCRNWMIHRFDMDCGGERVSWLRVADAARRYARAQAFVEAGKMHLRMGPLWSGRRDDRDPDRRWARERFADGAPYGYEDHAPANEIIDLPPGFAPAFGLPVSFEGGAGPSNSFDAVEGPPPAPKPYNDNAGWPDEDAYTPQGGRRYAQGSSDELYDRDAGDSRYAAREAAPAGRSGPLDPPVKKQPQKVQSAPVEKGWEPEKPESERRDSKTEAALPQKSGSTVAASAAKTTEPGKTVAKSDVAKVETPKVEAAKPEAAKPVAPKAEVAAAPPPKPAVPQTPPGVVTPTILNAPGAEKPPAPVAATKPVEAPPTVTPAPEKSSPPPPPPAPAPQAADHAEPRVAPPDAPAKTETAIPVIGLPSPSGSEQGSFALAPQHWLVASGAAALLTALAWLLLMGRNKGYDAGFPSRDLSAITLDGGPAASTSLVPVSAPPSPAFVPVASEPASLSNPPKTEIVMPTTLPEALEVLGVSADAGPGVLKKIVEGLRQSWHPDLARSNRDRRYREQRMAQINVAWDIIEASLRPAA